MGNKKINAKNEIAKTPSRDHQKGIENHKKVLKHLEEATSKKINAKKEIIETSGKESKSTIKASADSSSIK